MPTYILPLTSDRATLPLVGGKGANLARLARAGFPVPDGFLVTTEAYAAFVATNGLAEPIAALLPPDSPHDAPQSLRDAAQGFEAVSQAIQARFGRGSLPPDLAGQILAAYAALGRGPVAVRSSATAEDLPEMSFAGQQDTYLNVIGDESLLAAVIACWGSLWTARAISYRERNRVPHSDVSLAVVVQQMVESQASGVLFTANPLSGLRSETVIDATVGLGEALVAGQVDPDHYVVDGVTGQIAGRTLGAKALSVRSRPGGGTVTVAEPASAGQALPDEQIRGLAALGGRVADLYAAPQDIEWAWTGSALHLLQTRPITSLYPTPAGMAAGPLRVMFSFGGVQGMLDPMTPLGRDLVYQIFAAAARLFGMHLTRETQNVLFSAGERLWINLSPLLRNTVGRKLVPVITKFIDPGGGGALEAVWDDPRLRPTREGVSPRAALRIARFMLPLAGHVVLNLLAPNPRRRFIVDRGERLLGVAAAEVAAIRGAPRARLAGLVRMEQEFLTRHLPKAFRLFVSGVASGMASFNLVRVLTQNLPGISSDRLLEITRGLPNNPTTEMDLALWQVSRAIDRDTASREAFQGQMPAALAADFLAGSLPAAAQQALGQFMAKYGGRGLAEIDLGRPRWSEDPTHVMEAVAGYLQITDPEQAPDAVFARGTVNGNAAVDELVTASRQGRRGWLRARRVRFLASRARGLMGLRESPKFFAVRLFGIFRAKLLETGRELVATGELQATDDLFYLTFPELAAFAAGEGEDWAGTIGRRRETYRREALRRQVPRLLLSDGRAFYTGLTAKGEADGALAGSPVSPGSVTGRVRVVLDPRRAGLLPGEILVCRGTDPSWTPLFLTAAGLIMEVGGLMTHGAVVAREYGIPAVAGVDCATERLETGQVISLDGSTGEIRILAAAGD